MSTTPHHDALVALAGAVAAIVATRNQYSDTVLMNQLTTEYERYQQAFPQPAITRVAEPAVEPEPGDEPTGELGRVIPPYEGFPLGGRDQSGGADVYDREPEAGEEP